MKEGVDPFKAQSKQKWSILYLVSYSQDDFTYRKCVCNTVLSHGTSKSAYIPMLLISPSKLNACVEWSACLHYKCYWPEVIWNLKPATSHMDRAEKHIGISYFFPILSEPPVCWTWNFTYMLKCCKSEKTQQEILKAQLEDDESLSYAVTSNTWNCGATLKSHIWGLCVCVPVGVVHLVWNLHQFRWSSDQQMNRTTALWISLVNLLKDKHICVCYFTHSTYG